MTPSLRDAVEDAYRVFADAPVGPVPWVCQCPVCFGGDTETPRRLVTTPLREIPAHLLSRYTDSAHGWHDEMRYFLPRYLDLIAQGEVPCYIGTEYALSRLSRTPWRSAWPAAEREAVEAFFDALLVAALQRPTMVRAWWHPEGPPEPFYWDTPARDVLLLVANAGGDMERLLATFDATRGAVPDLHLAAMVNDTGFHLGDRRLRWETLTREGGAEAAIVDWLLRPETRARLEAAFFAASEPVDQTTLSQAVTLLEGARAP